MTEEEMMKLWRLCVDVNGTKRRCAEETGNLPTVFFDFLGHCALIIIRVYRRGWTAFESADKRFELYTDRPCEGDYNEALEYLEALKKRAERRVR